MPSIYGLPTIAEADSLSVVPAWSRDLARAIAANQAELLRATGKVPGLSPETAAGMLSRIATAESNISANTTALAPLKADTGKVTFTSAAVARVTETLQYRVRGGLVYLSGQVAAAAGSFPAGFTTLATLPPAARPAAAQRRAPGVQSTVGCYIEARTDGALVLWLSAASSEWIALSSLSYPNS